MQNLTRCLPLLFLFILQACQQKPAEATTPPMPATAPAATVTPDDGGPTVAQRFSPIISGAWVSANYLQEIALTRSPKASSDHISPGPSSLTISPFAAQSDSVEIGASYGLHEGGNLTLIMQTGTQPGSLIIREPHSNEIGTTNELAYQVTATDTTLVYITRKGKAQQSVSKILYRRTGMPGKKADLEVGVEQGVNKLLLAGSYTGTDSTGQQVAVRFLTDGRLAGLPFRKYTIQTDFAGPNPGDEIIFDVYTKQQREFAAEYGRDTVRLYTILSSTGVGGGEVDPVNTFTRGRLRYQLVRTKRP